MKKILFVIPFLSSGGAERVVSIWTSELSMLDVNVHLLVFYRLSSEYLVSDKVVIHSLAESEDEYNKLTLKQKIILMRRKFLKINPDIVIPFITYVGLITSLCKIGLKYNIIETIRIDPRYSPKSTILRVLRNLSILCSKRCIVQNKSQKDYFPSFMHKKIKVLPNPISNEFVDIKKVFIKKEIKEIVAVGRLEKQKGYKNLISAFANISKINNGVTLSIYGEGSLYTELNKYIIENNVEHRVFLKGRTNNIKDILRKSDMYILSSEAEGMPNSLMEAMAIGLPCISTDCPTGPSDLIENTVNGMLVSVNNSKELENAILYMINNVDKAIDMGKNARELVINKYGARASAQELKKFIEFIN